MALDDGILTHDPNFREFDALLRRPNVTPEAPTEALPMVTFDGTALSGGVTLNGIKSGNTANSRYFGFHGYNVARLKARGLSYPTYDYLSGAMGNAETSAGGVLGVSFDVNSDKFDLVQYGNYDDVTVWIDGRFVGRFKAAERTGTAQAGGASTITLDSGASATNGYYVEYYVTITSGTGAGQTRRITGYVGSTKVATVDTAWTTQPDATSVYAIVNNAYGIALDGLTGSIKYLHFAYPTIRQRRVVVRQSTFAGVVLPSYATAIAAPAPASLPLFAVSDSFFAGSAGPIDVPSLMQQVADKLGLLFYHLSAGGTGWAAPLTGSGGSSRLNFRDRIAPDDAWSVSRALSAGTFTITVTVNGTSSTTGALAYNASNSTMETAINALSNVVAAGGNVAIARGDFNTPFIFVGRNLPGMTLSFDTTAATGTMAVTEKWLGDIANNIPYDGEGNPLPFILLMGQSGNDTSVANATVSAQMAYTFQQIRVRFPSAIPIMLGLLGDAVVGDAGVIAQADLDRNAVGLVNATAYLPRIKGKVPFIDTYFEGLGGNKLLYGSGSVGAPTSGKTDVYKSLTQAGHPTGRGTSYLATWIAAQIATLLRGY